MNNVRIAVFVQSDQTREILQGGWAPLTGFSGVEEKGKGIGGPRGQGMEIIPNPFRGRCVINYWPSGGGQARFVVYDIRGRQVKALVEEPSPLAWDGKDEDGNAVPGGVYFVRLENGKESLTRRVVVLR
jgi:hypothetical protein